MRKLLTLILLFVTLIGNSQVINLSPDSTLYDLHLVPGTVDSTAFDRYYATLTFRLGPTGVTIAEIDTSDVATLTDTIRFYITGSDQPTPLSTVLNADIDTSLQVGGGVVWDSIVFVGGEIFWYSGGNGKNISEVIYTTPNAPTTLTISSSNSDTLTYAVSNFSSPANGTVSDSAAVRWDTIAIPVLVTDGNLVYLGDTNVAETDFFIDMDDSLKVYVSAFAKNDSSLGIGTWSVAKTDSVFIDSTGVVPTCTDDLCTDLQQYYSFETASGNEPDEKENYDLTAAGTIVYQEAGIVNFCDTLDGGGSTHFINNGGLAGDYATVSISYWLKCDGTAGLEGVLCNTDVTNGYENQLRSNGVIRWMVRDGDDGGNEYVESTTNVADNTWHHVVVVFNQPNIKIYVDGNTTPEATGTWNFTIDYSTSVFTIGSLNGGSEYDGSIDEVGIWNTEISTADITWLWNGGSGRSYTDIVNK